MTDKKKARPSRLENDKGQAARKSAPSNKVTPRRQDNAKATGYIQLNSRVTHKLDTVQPNKIKPIRSWGDHPESPRVFVTLEFDESLVSTNRKPTQTDIDNLGAISSLWQDRPNAENLAITSRDVWAALTGSEENPGKAALKRIEQSLDKLRRTMATLDIHEELEGAEDVPQFEDRVVEATLEGYLLSADKVKLVSANGRTVEGYIVHRAPILFEHDLAIKQVITMPREVLEAAAKANANSERNLLIRNYLYRRIKQRDRKNPKQRYINFVSVYKAAGYPKPSRTQAKNMRRAIERYLDTYKEKGVFASWEPYRSKKDELRNRDTGALVVLNSDND